MKFKNLSLAALSAPLYFFCTVEYFYRELRSSSEVVILFWTLGVISLVCSLIFFWQKAYSKRLLFGISNKFREGASRTSLLVGCAVGTPLSLWTWKDYEFFDMGFISPIPYILIAPGVAILGFMFVSTLVCAGFWCVEGFGSGNDERLSSGERALADRSHENASVATSTSEQSDTAVQQGIALAAKPADSLVTHYLLMIAIGFMFSLWLKIIEPGREISIVDISGSAGAGFAVLLVGWIFTRIAGLKAGWISVAVFIALAYTGR